MKKILLLIIFFIPFTVFAKEARDVSYSALYYYDKELVNDFRDNRYDSYLNISSDSSLKIKSVFDIKYVYIVYEFKSAKGKLNTSSETIKLGGNNYLHEFVELNNKANNLEFKYNEDVIINEVRLYTEGEIPNNVQVWTNDKSADLMLFSTHSDDEVLFFGGIIPTYLNEGKKVHVVYLTRHDICKYPTPERLHEVLDGLWESGLRDYPTFGILPDEHSKISNKNQEELENILNKVKRQNKINGFSDFKIIDFYTNIIDTYKPKVVLGHDVYGEYGHGQHIYNTYILKESLKKSTYKVPKVYLHMYGDSKKYTVIDLDKPLEKYNNKTAYQITQNAFLKHTSQQQSKYPAWLNGDKNQYTSAKDIKDNSPRYWGLYSSTVGEDKNKNNFFENLN